MGPTYDEAVAIQRRHETWILALAGVNAVGVRMTDRGPVLEVRLDDTAAVPDRLSTATLDGIPLRIARGGYTLQ